MEEFVQLKELADSVFVHDAMYDYIARLAKATRENSALSLGLSPRGSLSLCAMAKAMALMKGRKYILPDDVMNTFEDVASHRVVLSSAARIEKKTTKDILAKILQMVKAPKIKA